MTPAPARPTAASISPPPVFRLHLGAQAGERPAEDAVVEIVRRCGLESFSLSQGDGWFRGQRDPGWVVMLAHADLDAVAALAEALRSGFGQEGVGVEAFGRYLRCRADHGPKELAAELVRLSQEPGATSPR